jgi:hypothetical protein
MTFSCVRIRTEGTDSAARSNVNRDHGGGNNPYRCTRNRHRFSWQIYAFTIEVVQLRLIKSSNGATGGRLRLAAPGALAAVRAQRRHDPGRGCGQPGMAIF